MRNRVVVPAAQPHHAGQAYPRFDEARIAAQGALEQSLRLGQLPLG
jgi:hypothetical protein